MSPNCLDAPDSAVRIHEAEDCFGFHAKFIVVLREPVSRAFSAYQMFLNSGRQYSSFLSALAEGGTLFSKGLYGKNLTEWLDNRPVDDFLIMEFSDLVSEPEDALEQISRFMGLDSVVVDPYAGATINRGGRDKVKALARFRKKGGLFLRNRGMHTLLHRLKRSSMVQKIEKMNKSKITLDEPTREQAKRFFYDDVHMLDKFLPQKDLIRKWGYEKI